MDQLDAVDEALRCRARSEQAIQRADAILDRCVRTQAVVQAEMVKLAATLQQFDQLLGRLQAEQAEIAKSRSFAVASVASANRLMERLESEFTLTPERNGNGQYTPATV